MLFIENTTRQELKRSPFGFRVEQGFDSLEKLHDGVESKAFLPTSLFPGAGGLALGTCHGRHFGYETSLQNPLRGSFIRRDQVFLLIAERRMS